MKYNATFTSVWDGGLEVNSRCYADKEKHLITKIGKNDINSSVEEQLEQLEKEYITFDNGHVYKAVPEDEMDDYEEEVFGY